MQGDDPVLTFLKVFGVPGSIAFFALGVVLGLGLRYIWPAAGRGWLAGLIGLYVILSLPLVANGIANRLPSLLPSSSLARRPLAVIVFDGDNRRGRVSETHRIAGSGSDVQTIWILGGQEDWLLRALVEAGIQRDRISYDSQARTTRDQIARVRALVGEHPMMTWIVVASRLQAPRIAALLRRARLEVDIQRSPIDREPATSGIALLVPTYAALRVSRDAIYELAALAYYRFRGWID